MIVPSDVSFADHLSALALEIVDPSWNESGSREGDRQRLSCTECIILIHLRAHAISSYKRQPYHDSIKRFYVSNQIADDLLRSRGCLSCSECCCAAIFCTRMWKRETCQRLSLRSASQTHPWMKMNCTPLIMASGSCACITWDETKTKIKFNRILNNKNKILIKAD